MNRPRTLLILLVLAVGLACGGAPPSPPPPQPPQPPARHGLDLVDEATRRCPESGDALLTSLCAAAAPRRAPAGEALTVRLGVLMSPGAGKGLQDASFAALQFWGTRGMSVGSTIPRFDTREAYDKVAEQVERCVAAGDCPERGFVLPPGVYDQLQRAVATQGEVTIDEQGHLRARTPAGHGYPRYYEVVHAEVGPGYWVAAVGKADHLSQVGVFVDVPVIRGAP
jgi:hypothetical protein